MVVKIYGPFLGTLNIRGHTILGIQIGTMILTTTHIGRMEKKMETTIKGLGFRA